MTDTVGSFDAASIQKITTPNVVVAEALSVINDGALRYQGVVPSDLYREPYMTEAALLSDMADGLVLCGLELDGRLVAVAGTQRRKDVTLVRHLYVRRERQGRGLGRRLVKEILRDEPGPFLVGTLTAMPWAISFYQDNGFRILPPDQILPVRRRYWRLPEAHIARSIVLGDPAWFAREGPASAGPSAAGRGPERVATALQFLQILYTQITDHKAVRDRWFQYYLSIIGLPLGVLAGLSQSKLFSEARSVEGLYLAGSLASGVFLCLGLLFFMLFIGQRINYLAGYRRVLNLESEVIVPAVFGAQMDSRAPAMGQFRADSYAIGVHILINACWAGTTAYCVVAHAVGTPSSWCWIASAATFLAIVICQVVMRRRLLSRAEASMRSQLTRHPGHLPSFPP